MQSTRAIFLRSSPISISLGPCDFSFPRLFFAPFAAPFTARLSTFLLVMGQEVRVVQFGQIVASRLSVYHPPVVNATVTRSQVYGHQRSELFPFRSPMATAGTRRTCVVPLPARQRIRPRWCLAERCTRLVLTVRTRNAWSMGIGPTPLRTHTSSSFRVRHTVGGQAPKLVFQPGSVCRSSCRQRPAQTAVRTPRFNPTRPRPATLAPCSIPRLI